MCIGVTSNINNFEIGPIFGEKEYKKNDRGGVYGKLILTKKFASSYTFASKSGHKYTYVLWRKKLKPCKDRKKDFFLDVEELTFLLIFIYNYTLIHIFEAIA